MVEREEACNIVQNMLKYNGFLKLKTKVSFYDATQNAWRIRVYRPHTRLAAGAVFVSCETGCILQINTALSQYASNRGRELKIPNE